MNGRYSASATNTVTITVNPDPAVVQQSTAAEATFDPAPGGDVTITIKDETGTVVRQRTFTADPYRLTFVPVTTGTWSVTVTWPGNSRSKNFQVQ